MSSKNPFAVVASDVNAPPRRRASVFRGADASRLMADWLVSSISSDGEIRGTLKLLRARARDLVNNNPWCAGFIDECKNNIVGEVGIMLQARIRTMARTADDTPRLAAATNREIERAWKEWSHKEHCSANRKYSLVDVEDLLVETLVKDGEFLIRMLPGFHNDFGFTLQFIDVDLLDENYNRAAGPNQNEIRMGVELDRWGGVVGYWPWSRYASDTSSGIRRERIFVPAAEMIHGFIPLRPNQVRGVTWFAPILVKTKHLDGYEESELVAARAGASKMGFILNKQPEAIAQFEPPKTGDEAKTEDMEPGIIKELLPGQEYVEHDPKHPSTAFEMFTGAILRAMARGLKVSYLTLTGDLRAANYSSMRAGLLPERDRWRKLHGWLAEHFCRPVYRSWVRMALLSGSVRVDSRLASEYYEVEWKGRGWKWVDPVNDLAAAEKEVALGINSRQRLAAERGVDYEEIIGEREHEEAHAREHGVAISGGPVQQQPAARLAPPAKDAERPDGRDNERGPDFESPAAPDDDDEGAEARAAAGSAPLKVMEGGKR